MVIAFDQVSAHLDDLEVEDKRGEMESDDDEEPEPTNPRDQPQHDMNERNIIYERGEEGLDQIKQERLQSWLQITDGVGAQTLDRIMMIFERNKVFRENPHALHSMLDEQMSASSAYINTMVQDVFEPEREHEDVLRQQGYVPWYHKDLPGGDQAMRQEARGMYNGSGGQQQQQGMMGMQPGQQQPGGGGQGMSMEEAVELIRQSQEDGDEPPPSAREKIKHGMSEATDEAIRNAASEFGGFFSRINEIMMGSIEEYARENPEWIVENLDFLEKLLGEMPDKPSSDMGSESSDHDRRIDDAVNRIQQGGQQQQGSVGYAQSGVGFQPSPETQEAMQSTEPVEPGTDTEQTTLDEPKEQSQDADQDSEERESEGPPEDDGLEEIFGDLTE